MEAAGTTNNHVYITLIGSKAATGKVQLMDSKEFFEGGLKAHSHVDLVIETDHNLGDVQVVVLGIDGKIGIDNAWFVNYTMVYDFLKSKEESEFPCYHWIKEDESVSTTAATSKCSYIASINHCSNK